jgi:CxxC-x17-CxxC domain-containing protein
MSFKQNDRGGFRNRSSPNRFGPREGGFGRDRDSGRPREMTNVTCSKCGKECQVPFKPTGEKPVFCSDCFRQSESSRPSQSGGGMSSEQASQINAKLDRIIKVLEQLEIVQDDESDDDSEDESEEN